MKFFILVKIFFTNNIAHITEIFIIFATSN